MAERRMFAKTIIDSDAFLDMPLSTQALYFHLSMRADDEGFVNNPKKIARMIGADDDSLKLLIMKKFIIPFESGVVVIKHWRMHNFIQNDRFKPTAYQDERSLLTIKENGAYTPVSSENIMLNDKCIQNGYSLDTQDSIGKVSIGKDRKESDVSDKPKHSARFVPPTFEEVNAYCIERQNGIDAQAFIDFYESKGWMIGKDKMKSWKAAVRTWENRRKQDKPRQEVNQYAGFGDEFDI